MKALGVPDDGPTPTYNTPRGPQAVGAIPSNVREASEQLQNTLMRVDEGIDYSGVPSAGFRAGFSRMDTEEEREKFLQEKVGPENYDTDSFGRYIISPEGDGPSWDTGENGTHDDRGQGAYLVRLLICGATRQPLPVLPVREWLRLAWVRLRVSH